jgi:hypothetical protein
MKGICLFPAPNIRAAPDLRNVEELACLLLFRRWRMAICFGVRAEPSE